jgi:hypothetical protein
MVYSFDIELAKKYGVDESIVLQNFIFWISKNKASGKHSHDGKTWCYNSVVAFGILFPFWTSKQIERVLKSLKDQSVIVTGNYNLTAYDRTLWYAFSDESIFLNGVFHFTKRGNGFPENGEPIPDSSPVVNPDEEIPDAPASSPPRFKKPTMDEVSGYCQERGNGLDPAKWLAHYEANGWKVGKNPMRDWRAAVRTWEPSGFRPPRKAVVTVCPLCGKNEVDGMCFNPSCSQYDEAKRGGKSAEVTK